MSRICDGCNGQGRILVPGKDDNERAQFVEVMRGMGVDVPDSGIRLCSRCDGTGFLDE